MKGIYVITIAFLASWSVCTANKEQQSTQEIKVQDDYFRNCPYPDINPKNTTTNIAHESDCTKFYKCFLGKGTEQDCPLMWEDDPEKERLHYNRALQVCDWPWEAGCHLCPGKDKNGKYPPESRIADPNSDDCRDYIICKKNGKQEKERCEKNECFSRRCQDCVLKKDLKKKCDSDPVTTTTETTTTTTDDSRDECDYKEPHDCNCNLYYEKNKDGEKIRQECEGGLHFSPTECICIDADEAGCLEK